MKTRLVCGRAVLGLAGYALGYGIFLTTARGEAWKLDPQPVIAPGLPRTWNDYAIVAPSIIRSPGKFALWFEGVRFDRTGLHRAVGTAESGDGVAWTENDQNPAFTPELKKTEVWASPAVTQWREKLWCVYSTWDDIFQREKNDKRYDPAPVSARIARCDDRITWNNLPDAKLPAAALESFPLRPWIYAQGDVLHLWWLAIAEREPALFHSVSRDGLTWTRPNSQPAKEIDEREICCARVYPSGDFYILSYVAHKPDEKKYSLVTKISRDARNWTTKGPPEFALPDHWMHSPPLLVFDQNGARLFYSAKEPDEAVTLRSVRCSKADYVSR